MRKLNSRDFALGTQHLFAMFGATVLVPILTGFDPAMALVTAGIGTLLFHLCTKSMVPVFVGSSFAFIGALAAVVQHSGIPAAQGGIMAAGAIYLLFSACAKTIGPQRIRNIFPPIVTGPIIVVIGVGLAKVAVTDCLNQIDISAGITGEALRNCAIAGFTLTVLILCTLFFRGFLRLIPILIAIAAGYLLCVGLHFLGFFPMSFTRLMEAHWVNVPYYTNFENAFGQTITFFSLPSFELGAILSIAPIAIVTLMEHIGDITTNGTVVGKNFFNNPGLHRTLLGDGVATMVAGLLGGPANTTYSENTGVLATTGNYNPAILRLAAWFAIFLGFFGKFGAILQTIPGPVKGGVELMLFGMIAGIGIRALAEGKIDFTSPRNMIIIAMTLTSGLGIGAIGGIPVALPGETMVNISGLFAATVIGVGLNLLLPADEKRKRVVKS